MKVTLSALILELTEQGYDISFEPSPEGTIKIFVAKSPDGMIWVSRDVTVARDAARDAAVDVLVYGTTKAKENLDRAMTTPLGVVNARPGCIERRG